MEEIIALLPAIMQLFTGVSQAIGGSKAGQEAGNRPSMTTPPQVKQATKIAEQQAYGQMPGFQQAQQKIEQQGATGISNAEKYATSGSDVLGFAAGIQPSQNAAYGDLAAQQAQYNVSGAQNLQGALDNEANWNLMEQQDKLAAYNALKAQEAVEKEGGIQNIFGAVAGGGKNYLGMKNSQDEMSMYAAAMGLEKDPITKKWRKSTDQTIDPDIFKQIQMNKTIGNENMGGATGYNFNSFDPFLMAQYSNLWG